jgi:hypothetical protein
MTYSMYICILNNSFYSYSRNKFSSFASHRGFDEALCHGTVTLGFLHSTQPMSKVERRRLLLKIRQDSQEAMATQQRQAELARKDSQQK